MTLAIAPLPSLSATARPRLPLCPAALTGIVAGMRADPAAEARTEALAAGLGVPSFTFIRAFKQLTGLSPQRFRAALRIERAKRLLVETERPVTEICLDVGYESLGTFVRTFTLLVGVSPGQLRRLAWGRQEINPSTLTPSAASLGESRILSATLHGRPPTGTMVVAGLFLSGLPAGLPLDGSFVADDTLAVRLAWPETVFHANLLAAAFRFASTSAAWAGRFETLYVANIALVRTQCLSSAIQIVLRPALSTDPPVLTPFPLLALLHVARIAPAAARPPDAPA